MNKVQLMVGDTVKVLRSSIANEVKAGDVGVVIQSVKETKTNSVLVRFEHLATPVSLLQSEVAKCKSRKSRKGDAVVILAQQGFGERAVVSDIEEDTMDGTVLWVIRNGIMPQYEYAASLVRLLPKRKEQEVKSSTAKKAEKPASGLMFTPESKDLTYGDSNSVVCGVGLVVSLIVEPYTEASDFVLCYGSNDKIVSLFSLKHLHPIDNLLSEEPVRLEVANPKFLTREEFAALMRKLPAYTLGKGITIKGKLNDHVYDPNQEV